MKINPIAAAMLAMFALAGAAQAQPKKPLQAQNDAAQAQRAAQIAQAAAAAEDDAARAVTEQINVGATRMRTSRAPLSERDELAIAAIEGLMAAPADRALPILRKVLAGTHADVVKTRALFVLSQIDLPEAQQAVLDVVRTARGELQHEAVRMVGIGGDPDSLAALMALYNGKAVGLRDEILQALLIAGRKDLVLQIAKSASTEAEARTAIHTLSAMGATEELRQLGDNGKFTGSLIQAYAVAGDLSSLRRIAEGDGDVAQREDAIRSIGIIGSEQAQLALREVYTKTTAPQLKDAALQGLLISADQQGVLALYRAATSLEEKRNLLRTLSMMGGDAAIDAIDAALEGSAP